MADRRIKLLEAVAYHEKHIKGLVAEIAKIDEVAKLEAEIKAKQARLDQLKTPPVDWKDPRKIPVLQAALSRHPSGCDCSLCDGTDEIVKGLASLKTSPIDWKEPAKISEIAKDQKDATERHPDKCVCDRCRGIEDEVRWGGGSPRVEPTLCYGNEYECPHCIESKAASFWGHPPGCMCHHCYEARTKTKIPKGMQVCRLGGLCDDKNGKCECSPCS